jgi:PAS domain S-box-containing protein
MSSPRSIYFYEQEQQENRVDTIGQTAFISKGLEGKITSWDSGAEKIFGYSPDEAIGKHISIIIPFDYQDEEYELLDKLKQEDYLEVRETVRRRKDGSFLKVKLSATPIRDGEGKIVGALKKAIEIGPISAAEALAPPASRQAETPTD